VVSRILDDQFLHTVTTNNKMVTNPKGHAGDHGS
jgi:hypothetical protein